MKKKSVKKTKKVIKKSTPKRKSSKIKVVTKDITKKIIITDLMKQYPDSINIMFKYGLHCIGCGLSGSETLEEGCKSHMMSDQDINNMVDEINETLGFKEKKKEVIKISKPQIQEIKPIEKIPLEQVPVLKEKKRSFWNKLFKK